MLYKGEVVLKRKVLSSVIGIVVFLAVCAGLTQSLLKVIDLPIVEIDQHGRCTRVLVIEREAEKEKKCSDFNLKKMTYRVQKV